MHAHARNGIVIRTCPPDTRTVSGPASERTENRGCTVNRLLGKLFAVEWAPTRLRGTVAAVGVTGDDTGWG